MRLIYMLGNDHEYCSELAGQLSHFDYQVTFFSDGAEIEKAIKKAQPSAIIANMALSENDLSGITLVHKIKNKITKTSLSLLFPNTMISNQDCKSVRAGGDAYFVEPLDIGPLVDSLDELTQLHEAEPFRIIIVDDDHSLATHNSLILKQAGMNVTIVTEPRNITAALAEAHPELILMDVYMPTCSGLELAKLIRQQDAYLSTPIVFLSSETNLEKQFQAMRMGGDDFLTKPISDKKLVDSIMIRADRSRTLNTLMAQDSLTGLLKHTKIKEQLSVEFSRASRTKIPLSFAMIDIDHFKQVNDKYGHLTGDRVIKSLAHLLQQRLRQSDSIGRYGGEEFAAVLPGCPLENAKTVFEEIRADFADLPFLHEGQEIKVTISIGIASTTQYTSAESINHAADEAMYVAKNTGRNRVELAKAATVNADKTAEAE